MENEIYLNNLIKTEKKMSVTSTLYRVRDVIYERYITLLEATSASIKQKGYDHPEVKMLENKTDELHAMIRRLDKMIEDQED